MSVDQNPSERRALEMIATGTPAMFHADGKDRHCSLCAAHIGVAREALRWKPLPSEGGVPIEDGTTYHVDDTGEAVKRALSVLGEIRSTIDALGTNLGRCQNDNERLLLCTLASQSVFALRLLNGIPMQFEIAT